MAERSGLQGAQISIEVVRYTGNEGMNSQGCPVATHVSVATVILFAAVGKMSNLLVHCLS